MDKEYPLAFEVRADVFGLQVAHEMQEDASMIAATKNNVSTLSDLLPGKMYSRQSGRFPDSSMKSIRSIKEDKPKDLEILNFTSCVINKPSSQKFVLRNMSGIKTKFKFSALEYAPLSTKLPSETQIPGNTVEESETYSSVSKAGSSRRTKIRFAASTRRSGKKVKELKRPLLTDAHEHLNKFSSATGETFTATKRLEKE